jgi:hypothetical protein
MGSNADSYHRRSFSGGFNVILRSYDAYFRMYDLTLNANMNSNAFSRGQYSAKD